MFGPLILGFVAVATICFLVLAESNEINRLTNLYNFIKNNKGIIKSDLFKKLGVDKKYYLDKDFISISDWKIQEKYEAYVYIEYSYMGHCTGQPVRFLKVIFDKSNNFVKVKLSIGMSNTINHEYVKEIKIEEIKVDNLKIES